MQISGEHSGHRLALTAAKVFLGSFLLGNCGLSRAAAVGGCDAAHKYARLVQEHRYGEIGALFAQDAVWYTPVGKVMHGRQQVSDFYKDFLGTRRPHFQTDNYIEQGRFCAMEVKVKVRVDAKGKVILGKDGSADIIPDGSNEPGIFVRRAMDHFTVNDKGEVTRLIVYNAPLSYWVEQAGSCDSALPVPAYPASAKRERNSKLVHKRAPEMHQTKKGNQWYFGFEGAHRGGREGGHRAYAGDDSDQRGRFHHAARSASWRGAQSVGLRRLSRSDRGDPTSCSEGLVHDV